VPSLMSSFVHFFSGTMFFQTTSETDSLLCLAEVARLPLESSSCHVFNWCRDQEAVAHRQFSVSGVSLTMKKVQLPGIYRVRKKVIHLFFHVFLTVFGNFL